ncbi:MAG: DUF58 domain-containing protein [Deltaproteobacteria bacterium]|nr:DUF58 domain-containing protein [Deltaproteobacteria bacterium]MBW2180414.1 DUF58 domain-containing protein [Deltaproteobacteria bacterium]
MIKSGTLKFFFLRNAPIQLPHQLHWRRIFILPTAQGLLFIIILLGMLIGSINYSNNLGFLLTFLLGSMTFISMLYAIRNLTGIRIISSGAEPVFAEESAVFEFYVISEKDPRFAVTFYYKGEKETVKDITSDSNSKIKVHVMTKKRGKFSPGSLVISSRYPMGLFRAWVVLRINTACTVYPKPLAGQVKLGADMSSGDDENGNEIPGVDDFKELRPYQPGDPLQRISWKAFSRGLDLLTKSFVGKAGSAVFLNWDSVTSMNVEKKLSILTHGILKLHRMNQVYGLNLPGEFIDQGSGEAHKHKCLKALAMFALPMKDYEALR